jgi:hypothetical protein
VPVVLQQRQYKHSGSSATDIGYYFYLSKTYQIFTRVLCQWVNTLNNQASELHTKNACLTPLLTDLRHIDSGH